MEITDEVRAAVLAEQCATAGHILDISELIGNDAAVNPEEMTVRVKARRDDTIAHIRCKRCGRVWLVVVDGPSYDDAEDALNAQLALEHRRRLRREVRAERAAQQAAAAAAAAPVHVPDPPATPPVPAAGPRPG